MSDGTIKQPTTVMMAAGKELMRINGLWEQDRAMRMHAEKMINQLTGEIQGLTGKMMEFGQSAIKLNEAIQAYKEAMNADYTLNFT
jgi:hypothetical protein